MAAINKLGASIVSLEEIENSAQVRPGPRRRASPPWSTRSTPPPAPARWAFAPSPAAADLPPTAEQDVIRTAFIYKPADVSLGRCARRCSIGVGGRSPTPASRWPRASRPTGAPDSDAFAVIVNHFKSKGSGVDDGTGQGNANPDRVAQADGAESPSPTQLRGRPRHRQGLPHR